LGQKYKIAEVPRAKLIAARAALRCGGCLAAVSLAAAPSEMVDPLFFGSGKVELALKSPNRWWKLAIGIFFLAAAVDRAINGGVLPGFGPTLLYTICGVALVGTGVLRPRTRQG